jgi:hypothetical protein
MFKLKLLGVVLHIATAAEWSGVVKKVNKKLTILKRVCLKEADRLVRRNNEP